MPSVFTAGVMPRGVIERGKSIKNSKLFKINPIKANFIRRGGFKTKIPAKNQVTAIQ